MATPKRSKPNEVSISEKVRAVIEARKLSAYAVATAAGVDPPGVLRWLKGTKQIAAPTLDRIGAALGLQLVEGRGGLR